MSCDKVQRLISPLLDRVVTGAERESLLAHMESCLECSARFESMHSLKEALGGMAQPAVPGSLAAQLRVMASHERERQIARANFPARLRRWGARAQLSFENLMRPVALPFAGGVLSAILLFGLLVNTLSFRHDFRGDPAFFTSPLGLMVDSNGQIPKSVGAPRMFPVSAPITDFSNVVDLTIGDDGKVVEYSVVRGKVTEDLNLLIMQSQFKPATSLGLPTSGTVRVVQGPILEGAPYSLTVRS